MAAAKRPLNLTNALVAILLAVVLLALISTYLDQRSDLMDQRDAGLRDFADAKRTLQEEAELKQFLAGPGATMTDDAANVERQFLHHVHDWEDQTQVHDTSFQRVATPMEHGFTRLTFQITASGPIASVAGFLYRIETSPVPLRVDSVAVRPKNTPDNQLQMSLTVSVLCRGPVKATQPVASAAGGG